MPGTASDRPLSPATATDRAASGTALALAPPVAADDAPLSPALAKDGLFMPLFTTGQIPFSDASGTLVGGPLLWDAAAHKLTVGSGTAGTDALLALDASAHGGGVWFFDAGATGSGYGTGKLVVRDATNGRNMLTFDPYAGGRIGVKQGGPRADFDVGGTLQTNQFVMSSAIGATPAPPLGAIADPVYLLQTVTNPSVPSTGLRMYTTVDSNDQSSGFNNIYGAMQTRAVIGGTLPTVGGGSAIGTTILLANIADGNSEFANYYGVQRYDTTYAGVNGAGRAWFTDFSLHSAPAGMQHSLFVGISMLTNKYDASPLLGGALATGAQITTGPGIGGEPWTHSTMTTYPMDVGVWVVGQSGPPNIRGGIGWNTAFQAGGLGGAWKPDSIIDTGFYARDIVSYGAKFDHPKTSAATVIGVTGGSWKWVIDMTGASGPPVGGGALNLLGQNTFKASANDITPLVLREFSNAHTADLLAWENGTPSRVGRIAVGGFIDLGGAFGTGPTPIQNNEGDKVMLGGTAGAGGYGIGYAIGRSVAFAAAGGGFAVRQTSGTGAKSSGADAIVLFADGHATFAGLLDWAAANTQPTVGAAGGAAAMPAAPTGYLRATVDGVAVVIPYFAAA